MPRLLSAPFFSANPVFRRHQYASAVGRDSTDKVVSAMLAQHVRAGNIKRLARGVYASVPGYATAGSWPVDHFLAASRLREGGVIGYHSAMELHGYAYSVWQSHVQVITQGRPCVYEAKGFSCHFVRSRRPIETSDTTAEGVTRIDRLGLEINVTTVERTIADLFDRPALAGGVHELFDSLRLVGHINARELVAHAAARASATAAGALGYWLEQERQWLSVPMSALAELRRLAPSSPRYALGARPGNGKTVSAWNVILPADIVQRRAEGS